MLMACPTPRAELVLPPAPGPATPPTPTHTPDAGVQWGLHHSDETLAAYPAVREPQPTSRPLRLMTPAQLHVLHKHPSLADVPARIVFPYLYGLHTGDSRAQGMRALFGLGSSPPLPPPYRGLTIVRADMPAPGDTLLETCPASPSPTPSTPSSTAAELEMLVDLHPSTNGARLMGSTSSTSSQDTFDSRASLSACSMLSLDQQRVSISSSTSIESDAPVPSASLPAKGRDGPTGPVVPVQPPQKVQCRPRAAPESQVNAGVDYHMYQPQPAHSRLLGSIDARKFLAAPRHACARSPRASNAGFFLARPGTTGAGFVPPPRPASGEASSDLRNFAAQHTLYASVSDIVVYCPAGLHSGMIELGTWIAQAQQEHELNGGLEYNVFLIEEAFDAFDASLIAVAATGEVLHHHDVEEDERNFLEDMVKAVEVAPNVFVGGPMDAPVYPNNPEGWAIVLHAGAAGPVDPSRLTHASHFLDELEAGVSSVLGAIANTGEVLCAACTRYCREMGEFCLVEWAPPWGPLSILDRWVDLLAWVGAHAEPQRGGQDDRSEWRKKVLIYSDDGYTESTVFMLSYIMWRHRLSLPQAFLHAHVMCRKDFHTTPDQLVLLSAIEAHIHARLCGEGSSPLRCFHLASASFSTEGPEGAWIKYPTFDGSFPSRILPSLYLGNEHHARNAGLLQAIGITHVLSVGESPLLDSVQEEGLDEQSPDLLTLAGAWSAGALSVREIQGVPDDGVGELRGVLAQAVEFLATTQKEGGRVLVHCRAGVSRSATIVMAYLISELGWSLEHAYSHTRTRRLAVLIQPTLLFFWELMNWETQLARRRRLAAPKTTWHALAASIAKANARYDH